MVETLIAFRRLRTLILWKHCYKLGCQNTGVQHLVLGVAGVNANALDGNFGRGSVEVLKLQLTHVAAVHRVGPLAAETLYVEVVGTHPDFLVRVEGHADFAVLYFLVFLQIDHRLNYLGNARLVVGTQQCCAIGHNQVFTYMTQQLRKFLGR